MEKVFTPSPLLGTKMQCRKLLRRELAAEELEPALAKLAKAREPTDAAST